MMDEMRINDLIGPEELTPVVAFNNEGRAPVLVVSCHAGRAVPERLNNLGLTADQLDTHDGWDIGVQMVSEHLCKQFDAPGIFSAYSRLVIDCNRRLWDPGLIRKEIDGACIPRNVNLTNDDVGKRIEGIYLPYHYAIARKLELLASAGVKPLVLAVHSCTPVYNGEARPWSIGIAHSADESVSRPVFEELSLRGDYLVGDNEPYSVDYDIDYTVVAHGLGESLPHLFIEFRQDLISTRPEAERWADVLYEAICAATPHGGK
jgi:predicted N-formylglutamate amidohydrolase